MTSWALFLRHPRARHPNHNFRANCGFLAPLGITSCKTITRTRGKLDGGSLDFQLNDEQVHLKKTVREFAEREIAPNVMKWDEACEFPLTTIKELGKLGLLGIIFPPEYGGAGMGYVEYVTAIEELARVDGSVGIIVAAHTSLCSHHLYVAGKENQKKEYVSKRATPEHTCAPGLYRRP